MKRFFLFLDFVFFFTRIILEILFLKSRILSEIAGVKNFADRFRPGWHQFCGNTRREYPGSNFSQAILMPAGGVSGGRPPFGT
ncbi:hypothetical protein AAEU42_00685 [Pseudoflavonifractor phocaeensis]|uniref:hypothetical protein n=1 Tax=Pseudoflavonifractor phocaeensis TaxID=1870988 RepID=UPI00313F19B2